MQPYAASDSELPEEIFNKRSPRASLSANEDENPSGTATPRRKFSKFHIGKGRKPFSLVARNSYQLSSLT